MVTPSKDELRTLSEIILNLLKDPRSQNYDDSNHYTNPELMQVRIDCLHNIFVSFDIQLFINILREVCESAPDTCNMQWEILKQALFDAKNNPQSAVLMLTRFIGWACIETLWKSDFTSFSTERMRLAALALDINHQLESGEIAQILLTYKKLIGGLLINKFDENVVGGLSKLTLLDSSVNNRINDWEKRLSKTEEVVISSEEKLKAYEGSLEKYKVAFGFLGLSSAFKEFFSRKTKENRFWAALSTTLVLLILSVAIFSHFIAEKIESNPVVAEKTISLDTKNSGHLNSDSKSNNKLEVIINKSEDGKLSSETGRNTLLDFFSKYMPIFGIEFLLIYFFRIALMHFNSTKGQLLQLEIRMALCAFIDDYVKFAKDNNHQDLSKFEAMLFSAIVPDTDKIPSTFDGIDQLSNIIKSIKGN